MTLVKTIALVSEWYARAYFGATKSTHWRMRRCEGHNVTSRSDGMHSHAVAGFTEMMILAVAPPAYILWWEALTHDVFKESLIWHRFENRPTYRQGRVDKHARAYWLYIVVPKDPAPFSSL